MELRQKARTEGGYFRFTVKEFGDGIERAVKSGGCRFLLAKFHKVGPLVTFD